MITETYTASAGQKIFTFTFDVISAAYLTVTLDDLVVTDWELTGSHEITLGATVNPTSQQALTISRSTPIDQPLVTFSDPSAIRAREIDLAIKQVLHNLQEQGSDAIDALIKSPGGTAWAGEGLVLKDIAEPVDGTDAATKDYVTSQIVSSGQLPPVGPSEAGNYLAVNNVGTGFEFAPPPGSKGLMVLETTPGTEGLAGQRGGQILQEIGDNIRGTNATTVGIGLRKIAFNDVPTVNENFTDALTWNSADNEITLPAGHLFRIKFQAQAHNLASAGGPTVTTCAAIQLRTPDIAGFTVFDGQTLVFGRGESNPGNSDVHSGTFALDTFIDTSLGAVTVFLGGAARTGGDQVAIDTPSRLIVEEVR